MATTRSRSRSSKGASRKGRTSSKRELIKPKGDARYVRRDSQGQFKESDDMGRSLKADRRTKAKRKVSSGQGDRGDRS